jgi:hypothetical protein
MDEDAKRYLEQFGVVQPPKKGEKIQRAQKPKAWEHLKNPKPKTVRKPMNATETKQSFPL